MTDLVRDEKYSAEKKTPAGTFGSKKRYTEDSVLMRPGMTIYVLGKEPWPNLLYGPVVIERLQETYLIPAEPSNDTGYKDRLYYDSCTFFSTRKATLNAIGEWRKSHGYL